MGLGRRCRRVVEPGDNDKLGPRPADLQRQTRRSYLSRVRQALPYNPRGPLAGGDLRIVSNPVVEGYVTAVIDRTASLTDDERQTIRDRRRDALDSWPDQRAVEVYRRLSPETALEHL